MISPTSETQTLEARSAASRLEASRLANRLDGASEIGTAVRELLERVARGDRLVVLRSDDEITPAEAGKVLGVSRQFVDRLLADGRLSYRRLPGSRHRRISVGDVAALAEERARRQEGAEIIRSALNGPAH